MFSLTDEWWTELIFFHLVLYWYTELDISIEPLIFHSSQSSSIVAKITSRDHFKTHYVITSIANLKLSTLASNIYWISTRFFIWEEICFDVISLVGKEKYFRIKSTGWTRSITIVAPWSFYENSCSINLMRFYLLNFIKWIFIVRNMLMKAHVIWIFEYTKRHSRITICFPNRIYPHD